MSLHYVKYMVIIHHLIGIIATGSIIIINGFLMFKITWDLIKGFYEVVF